MPCYQSTSLPSGVTTTGRTGYRTEAECLQTCKEGACCEGTTCTVKPQCQCKCTTGRCCGPDTTTAGGTTWKTCRNETKAQCDARGGVFQCGVPCTTGVIGDAAGSTGGSVCLNGTGDVANAGPVFKGVGTTCEGSPCKCCCINGTADTTKGEQDCVAAGGTVNSYPCNSPSPATMLLTLSLTGYDLTSQFFAGVRRYDFSCIKNSYTLQRGFNWNGQLPGYSLATPEASMGWELSTTGSFSAGYANVLCSCAVPQLRGAVVVPRVEAAYTTSERPALNCSPGNSQFDFALFLVPAGNSFTSPQDNINAFPAQIPSFCTGQYSVSGNVFGPGSVQCGTFTIGNPLP